MNVMAAMIWTAAGLFCLATNDSIPAGLAYAWTIAYAWATVRYPFNRHAGKGWRIMLQQSPEHMAIGWAFVGGMTMAVMIYVLESVKH
jgi:hypothetical protein